MIFSDLIGLTLNLLNKTIINRQTGSQLHTLITNSFPVKSAFYKYKPQKSLLFIINIISVFILFA